MKLINQILLLLIILVLIYHLTDGKIFSKITDYLFTCKDKIQKITKTISPDKIKLSDNDVLFNFINTRTNPNFNIPKSNNEIIKGNANIELVLINSINKVFNYREFKFINIKLLDNISYRLHPQGKELLPFSFSADVLYYNKPLSQVIINIDGFLREDLITYNNDNIFLEISKIKLIERNKLTEIKNIDLDYEPVVTKTISKVQKEAIQENKKLADKMTESFTNHFVSRENFDDLFIKPESQVSFSGFNNDTENSLIPSIVELSAYERTSETQTSNY